MTALLSAPVSSGRPQRSTAGSVRVVEPGATSTALPRPEHPWQHKHLMSVWVSNGLGLALLLGGLLGTRQTTDPSWLVVLMNVSALGLVVALVGNAVFLLYGLRQVGLLRSALLVRRPYDDPALGTQGLPAVVEPVVAPDALVATAEMTRYHLSTCAATAGKPVVAAPLEAHLADGRRPCGLCHPQDPSEETA